MGTCGVLVRSTNFTGGEVCVILEDIIFSGCFVGARQDEALLCALGSEGVEIFPRFTGWAELLMFSVIFGELNLSSSALWSANAATALLFRLLSPVCGGILRGAGALKMEDSASKNISSSSPSSSKKLLIL